MKPFPMKPLSTLPTLVPTCKKLRRKELLSLPADTLWEIESGFVRIVTWDEEGNVTTLGLWGPGEHLELSSFGIYPYQVECLTPARFHQVTETPEQSSVRLRHKTQRTEELLYLLQIRCTRSRLQHVLHWLAERFGHSTPAGQLLPLRLTHQELADLIGSTRVTVTRILNQLQSQGEVQLLCRQIVLPSRPSAMSLLPPFNRSTPLAHAQSS